MQVGLPNDDSYLVRAVHTATTLVYTDTAEKWEAFVQNALGWCIDLFTSTPKLTWKDALDNGSWNSQWESVQAFLDLLEAIGESTPSLCTTPGMHMRLSIYSIYNTRCITRYAVCRITTVQVCVHAYHDLQQTALQPAS